MSKIIVQGVRTKWDWKAIAEERKTSSGRSIAKKYGVDPAFICQGLRKYHQKLNPPSQYDLQFEFDQLKVDYQKALNTIQKLKEEVAALRNKPDVEQPYQPSKQADKCESVGQVFSDPYKACKCGEPVILRRNKKEQKLFWGCSARACGQTRNLTHKEAVRLNLDAEDMAALKLKDKIVHPSFRPQSYEKKDVATTSNPTIAVSTSNEQIDKFDELKQLMNSIRKETNQCPTKTSN